MPRSSSVVGTSSCASAAWPPATASSAIGSYRTSPRRRPLPGVDARVKPLVVHAPDEPAFVLPFMASGDDDVTLYVEVSDALREAGFRPHRFVEVSLGEEPVLLPRTGPILNRVEVDLPVEGVRGIRYATLALSEKGFERLNAGEVIGVSAVVQVRRER